jgi:hypothetical protein
MATKKTALASVTKKPVDADAWVNARPKSETPAAAVSDKPARLVVELSPELHRKLKGKCGVEGLKIKDVVNDLLQSWVNT